MSQATFSLRGRNPDVLTCIANLSNDEVFTPPEFANQMLNTLETAWAEANGGASIWADPTVTFLDPFTKSGVFLREITVRLTAGLTSSIPNLRKRVDHILTKQVFGIGITQLTSLLARRSLYCSKLADGKHSIATSFTTNDGNVWFERTEHTWGGRKRERQVDPISGADVVVDVDGSGRCEFCGANEAEYSRSNDLETHAYAFIHTTDIKARIAQLFGADMHFDVIIGNPPYQLGDGGGGNGSSATPIYNLFVDAALSLEPRYVSMVTPSRWFSGGKGLDDFRHRMIRDHRFVKLVDFPQLYDVFPGVKIRGGVSYWLWGRDHDGGCEVVTKIGNEEVGESAIRNLDAYDVLVRRNEAVKILEKVSGFSENGRGERSLGDQVSARKPFGLTNQKGKPTPEGLSNPVLVYGNQQTSYLERSAITANSDWVDRWKVMLVKAHGTSGREDMTILGEPVVAGPSSACTETYLVIGVCDSEQEAKNLAAYMRTRFVRFLVSLRKITQNITRDSYRFVPALPVDRTWTDTGLYGRYGLDASQVEFIEKMVSERPINNPLPVIDEDDD